jgi:hypothetical protein
MRADNRNGHEFTYRTVVSNTDGSCPTDLKSSTDVFVSRATDGGVTWFTRLQITHDPQDFDNWFPLSPIFSNRFLTNSTPKPTITY